MAAAKAAAFLILSILIVVIDAGKTYPDIINDFADYFNFGGKKMATKLNRDRHENSIFKSKVDILGSVFKLNVDNLKIGGVLDLVFLIDASSSVGESNFRSELKFVKKLLSDVTVDFNHTRIAIVTFSSQEHVVSNINEISMPTETNNKCLLLNKELNEIKYSGGGTYTLGAFQLAQEILNGSREEAKKVIFLITDGFSNGGDPIPVAKELKALGVTIFTIGIINGNYKELFQLASEPGEMHSFLLDSFEEFESLARRALHVDLQSGDYIPLGSNQPCNKLCTNGNCCDNQALCTCGTTTGHYACLCKPGYYGSGLKNGCSPCPSGSYASGPNLCLPCPDINHYTYPPAIGISSCTCKSGYKATDNLRCEGITCPQLKPPENGYFVKRKNCSNVLNSACGVRCFVGYTLIGSSIRLCQSNATWSGLNPSCEVKTCNKLQAPPHGSMYCKHSELGEDFTAEAKLPVDTVCTFACERGRTLIGSTQRTCLPLARWDGLRTACKQIKCNRLSQINFGTVEPKSCTTGKQSFGKKCNINCNEGFELVGPSQKVCSGQHGTWDSLDEVFCKDVTKPDITCPGNLQAESLTGKPYGFVSWETPNVTDNSNLNVSIWTKPSIKKAISFKFKIGITVITYFAQDAFKNRAKCNFTIEILDKQPPIIEQCIDPPPFLTIEKQPQNLTWDEPNIYDNSQNVNIHKSHEFGLFNIGTTQVEYTATDFSNNTAICTLNITLQESKCEDLPDPIFGHSECQPFSDQIQCVVTCDEGYALPLYESDTIDVENSTKFICEHSQPIWYSNAGALLGCSINEIPLAVNHTGVVVVEDQKELCLNESNLYDFGNDIGNKLTEDCEGFECKVTTEAMCMDDEKEDDEEATNIIKREISGREKIGRRKFLRKKKVNIKFSLSGKNTGLAKKIPNFSQIRKINGLSVHVQKSKVVCPRGSFSKKLKCVRCPEGTFHNETSNSCQSCTIGSYNDKQGQLFCSSCPDHYSTRKLHAKSADDCIEQCPPGTYARKKQIKRPKNHPNSIIERTTLKPYCTSCPLGQYQSKYGQINCQLCPSLLTTFARGGNSVEDCVPNTDYQCQIEGVCNSGQCMIEEFHYTCLCDENHIGSHCEISSEPCSSNPCQNNGTCINVNESNYKCKCPEGYSGSNCGEIIDSCKLACANGGTCLSTDDGEMCLCATKFSGDLCENKLVYCFDNLCQNNGICEEVFDGFNCVCQDGFVGRRCNYLPCDYQPCPENAICYNENSTFKCECIEGYEGVNCTDKIDPCKNVNCENGNCEETENFGYTCSCFRGFSGINCDLKLKEDYILNFPRSSTTDFVALNGFKDNLTQVSVCLWVKTNDSFNYGTILSYATPEYDNSFTITDYTGLVIYINNNYIVSDIILNNGHWNYFCLTWQSLSGGYKIYLNGKLTQNGTNLSKGQSIKGGGKLILGQEQDVLGGKFSRSESFLGKMAYLEMHSKVLDQSIISDTMNSCNQSVFGDLYTWPEIAINIKGDVTVEDSTFCQNCPPLEAPHNGNVSVTNLSAFYSCNIGYTTNITQRICTKASKWDKNDPICEAVKCGHPGYILNGGFRGRRFTYSEEIHYKCNYGFNLTGTRTRICKEDGNWYPEAPKCIGMQCHKFLVPDNAKLLVLTEDDIEGVFEDYDNFDVGLQVEFRCEDTAELDGESVLTCLNDGNWDYDVPTCKASKKLKIPCSLEHIPQPPTNGYLDEDSLALVEKNEAELIYYKCRTGYKMQGSNVSTCIIDGYWTELEMTCLANMCPNPPKYVNMVPKLLKEDQIFQIGNMLTYECLKGYKGFSNMRLRCMSNGNWGRMLGKCFKISCGKPNIKGETQIIGRSYLYNDTIKLICADKSEKSLLCESDGKWKGDMENC